MKRIFSAKGLIISFVLLLLLVATYFYGSIMYEIVVHDIINSK